MRDRHNIVGSEVGRPRPPVYMLRTLRLTRRRRVFPWAYFCAAVVVLVLAGAIIQTW